MSEAAKYRCRQCDTIVPRGHRMQQCECGSVFVDWGAFGKSSSIRVGWPDGNYEDWVELMAAPENEYDTGTPGPERPMTGECRSDHQRRLGYHIHSCPHWHIIRRCCHCK